MSDSLAPDAPEPARRIQLGGMAIGALATVGLAVTLVAGAAVATFLFAGRGREAPAQVQAKAASEVFAVADVNALAGTGLTEIVIATAGSIRRGGGSYSSGEPADERNVILLDKASGANRKLLPDNSRRIVARDYLPAAAGASDAPSENFQVVDAEGKKVDAPLAYYLLRVRAADDKSEDVLVGDLASGRQAFVLTGIDGIDRVWMQSPTRVALLLRQGRKLVYRAIEIPQLKVVVAHPVEID